MQIVLIIGAAVVLLLVLRAVATRGEKVACPNGLASDATELTEDSIRGLLIGGRKIEAIKAYRRLHRVDLKDAREAVERLAATLPPSV